MPQPAVRTSEEAQHALQTRIMSGRDRRHGAAAIARQARWLAEAARAQRRCQLAANSHALAIDPLAGAHRQRDGGLATP